MENARVGLGQLLLALDRTMVSLVAAPRGLDLPVGSVALVDADDLRLGLAAGAGRDVLTADVFFLLGVAERDAVRWIDRQVGGPNGRVPAAIFAKEPSEPVVARAVACGAAVVAVDPRARWERLYRLVTHVFEHHGDPADPQFSGVAGGTDLFGLAQSIADRVHGMISIEDVQSHVLAYSAHDEADELRRLSILGRAGPPEHLAWIAQWGIFDALRAGGDVVQVAERPELGLRPRLAVGIHRQDAHRTRTPDFMGTIWVQQGSRPLADDAEEVLRGAAVLAARIMSRLAARPTAHAVRVAELLGLAGDELGAAWAAPSRRRRHCARARCRRRRAGRGNRLRRRASPASRPRRRRRAGASGRYRTECQCFSSRCPGRVGCRPGVCAAAPNRRSVRPGVVGAGHRRRAAA